jgi:hypothetical protein
MYDVPDEIIAHLTMECGGNVHDRHVVDVTSGEKEKMRERLRLTSVHSRTRSGQSSSTAQLTAATVISRHSRRTTWDAKLGSALLSGKKIERLPSSVRKTRVRTWLCMTVEKSTRHSDVEGEEPGEPPLVEQEEGALAGTRQHSTHRKERTVRIGYGGDFSQ